MGQTVNGPQEAEEDIKASPVCFGYAEYGSVPLGLARGDMSRTMVKYVQSLSF
jgi:hypothetical protein